MSRVGEAVRMGNGLLQRLARGLDPGTLRSTVRNVGWLVAGEGAYRISRFAVTIMVARYLGAADFGRWSFALSLALLFGAVADAGLATVAVRDIAADRSRSAAYLGKLLGLKVVLGLLVFGGVLVAGALLAEDRRELGIVYSLGAFAVVISVAELLYSVCRAHERMDLEAAIKFVLAALIVGLPAALVAVSAPLQAFGLAWLAAAGMTAALGAALVGRLFGGYRLEFDGEFSRQVLRSALPVALASFAFLAYTRLDVVMLQQISGARDAGLYSAAFNFVFPAIFVPLLIVAALFPAMSSDASDEAALRGHYRIGTALLGVYTVAAVVLFLGAAELFYVRLYGAEYEDSLIVVPLLVAASALFYFGNLNYFALYARRRERIALAVSLGGLVVNLALNVPLILRYDVMGAAIATVATQSLVLAVLVWENREIVLSRAGR